MMLSYWNAGVFIWGLSHQLGSVRRDLNELKSSQLLSNSVNEIAQIGYRHNFGVGPEESLLTLAVRPFSYALGRCRNPQAVVFHHSYAESAIVPWAEEDVDVMSRARYFPAALMRQVQVDHLPYLGSFASGCTGFLSLMLTAGGLFGFSDRRPIICLTADVRPRGASYDALREKILTSDCSAGFILGGERCGYQLVGINYYSTTRTLVPLVEIVKRTVKMIADLTEELGLDLAGGDTVLHYPNIFPKAWDMVTHYLQIPRERHVMDGMPDRAHCLSSDPVITLAKLHRSQTGRLHVVVNFGSGLHLGVCIFKEEGANAPII